MGLGCRRWWAGPDFSGGKWAGAGEERCPGCGLCMPDAWQQRGEGESPGWRLERPHKQDTSRTTGPHALPGRCRTAERAAPCVQSQEGRATGARWAGGGGGRQMDGAAPQRGREAFVCDKGGGRPPGAGNGEHKAEGLEMMLDVDQRRLENSATRLCPRTRGSTLLHPLIRGPPPACSLLPGSAYRVPEFPGCPLGPGASMPLPAPGPWLLEVVGGWGPGHSQTAPYALLFSAARRQAKGSQGNACQKHGLSYSCVKSMRAVKLVLGKRSQSNLG